MRVGIAADHRGFALKEKLLKGLPHVSQEARLQIKFRDFGTFNEEPVDYPDYAFSLTAALKKKEVDKGVLICGSGLGMSIAANKVKGIRAALCLNQEMAKMARNHNNANVLVLAANFTQEKEAVRILLTFLKEKFEGGRHKRRLDKISSYEKTS